MQSVLMWSTYYLEHIVPQGMMLTMCSGLRRDVNRTYSRSREQDIRLEKNKSRITDIRNRNYGMNHERINVEDIFRTTTCMNALV